MRAHRNRAFTAVELSAVIGIIALLMGTLAPAVRGVRMDARARGSASNLMMIGQGTEMYALDNKARIFSYTWEAGLYKLPNGKFVSPRDDQAAASDQSTEILMRRTGRTDGDHRIRNARSRVMHRRWRGLVLMDYLDRPFPDTMFIDPNDANQFAWAADPLDYWVGSGVPYAPGSDIDAGYDDPVGWSATGVLQRWAFASSYQSVPASWQGDGLRGSSQIYVPTATTPNKFLGGFNLLLHPGRRLTEVRYPSAKVHMFEEFDREQAGSPYFGYDHARPTKLMFDGSVNEWASGDAAPSTNPALGRMEWRQTYVPLHTFPIPLGGLGDQTLLSQRYRWTLGGLRGVDYRVPSTRPPRR